MPKDPLTDYQDKKRYEQNVFIDNVLSIVAAVVIAGCGIYGDINPLVAMTGGVFVGAALKYVYGEPKKIFTEEEKSPIKVKKKERGSKENVREEGVESGIKPTGHRSLRGGNIVVRQ